MSLSKKGLRKIEVNGNTYQWTIRKRATSGIFYQKKKLIAAIQIETDSERGLLVVDFGISPPSTWRNPHKTSVTPKTIASAIENALERQTKEKSKLYDFRKLGNPESFNDVASFKCKHCEKAYFTFQFT